MTTNKLLNWFLCFAVSSRSDFIGSGNPLSNAYSLQQSIARKFTKSSHRAPHLLPPAPRHDTFNTASACAGQTDQKLREKSVTVLSMREKVNGEQQVKCSLDCFYAGFKWSSAGVKRVLDRLSCVTSSVWYELCGCFINLN